MSRYTDQLWRDLVREHGATLATAGAAPHRTTSFLKRPRVLAGGSLGLAGVGAALALILTAGGAAAPPAFAITNNANGSLTVNLDDPGNGLFPLNNKLAKDGYGEHVEFTMAQGPASAPGLVDCVAQGANVPGPAIQVTVGPGDSNTETIPSSSTGAGVWHVQSCQRYAGDSVTHMQAVGGGADRVITVSGASRRDAPADRVAPVAGQPAARVRPRLATRFRQSPRRQQARRYSGSGPVALNLDTDGGLVGANRKLAAMGTDESIAFVMAQGPASAAGVVSCVPDNASVTGPAITVTVGSGDSNTETIAAGNTGAGVWHVKSCTRDSGTDTQGIPQAN